jgi:hypothetical protein
MLTHFIARTAAAAAAAAAAAGHQCAKLIMHSVSLHSCANIKVQF